MTRATLLQIRHLKNAVVANEQGDDDAAANLIEIEIKLASTLSRISRTLTLKRNLLLKPDNPSTYDDNVYWDLLHPMANLADDQLFEYLGGERDDESMKPTNSIYKRLHLLERVLIKDMQETFNENLLSLPSNSVNNAIHRTEVNQQIVNNIVITAPQQVHTTNVYHNVIINNTIVSNTTTANNTSTVYQETPPLHHSRPIDSRQIQAQSSSVTIIENSSVVSGSVNQHIQQATASFARPEQYMSSVPQILAPARRLPQYIPLGTQSIPYVTPGFRPPASYVPKSPNAYAEFYAKNPSYVGAYSVTPGRKEIKKTPSLTPDFTSLNAASSTSPTASLPTANTTASLTHQPGNVDDGSAQVAQVHSKPNHSDVTESTATLFDGVVKYTAPDVVVPDSVLSKKSGITIFKLFNVVRACGTCAFGVYEAYKGLNNAQYVEFGAEWLMIATMVFLFLDLVVAFVKAFPERLWVCWDVERWRPCGRSVFSLICDHQLITDIVPVMLNVVCKVYSTRLAEVVENPYFNADISTVRNWSDVMEPQYHNSILLLVFISTLVYQITYHTFSIALTLRRKSVGVASFVVVKGLLLSFDLTVTAFLLYQTLQTYGKNFLRAGVLQSVVLSIVIPGPVVSLFTNALVNLPLYYFFVRMQDKKTFWRNVKSSASRAFHPLITSVFGSYSVYLIVAIFYVLRNVRDYDPFGRGVKAVDLTSIIPPGFEYKDLLLSLVIFNTILNYAVGAACCLGYWVYVFLHGIVGGDRGLGWLKKRSGLRV